MATGDDQSTLSSKNINAPGGQFGVVGDNVTIQGGIHFHGGSPPSPLSSDAAGSPAGGYDLRKVQALLNDVFSEDELRDFCLYEADFQPVYDELKDSDRKSDILRRLISYARQKGLVARLLMWARETNEARYTRGEPYEGSKPVRLKPVLRQAQYIVWASSKGEIKPPRR